MMNEAMMPKERDKDPSPSGMEFGMPRAAVGRLSLYLRQLESFHRSGHETVSSNQLGQALEITDAQVRKDLAYFGQFGYPGIGYRVVELRDALKAVLGTNRTWPVALIGIGNLGRALLGYGGFQERGFVISALFDRDPGIIGKKFRGLEVRDLQELPKVTKEKELRLAVLAVPAPAADSVAQAIVAAGITGILNFAPVRLKVPEDVGIVSVDLGLQLEQLAFQVNQRLMTGENGSAAG
jgi:redox-sensing transcriptional repressor